MKAWLLVAMFLSMGFQSVAADFGADKAAHFAASYGISLTFSQFCKKILSKHADVDTSTKITAFCAVSGFIFSTGVGYIKEFQDPNFDWADIGANFAGNATSTFLNIAIDF